MNEITAQRPAILCDLLKTSLELGHGGRHRCAQLRELVVEAGFEPVVMPVECGASNLNCYWEGLRIALRLRVRPGEGWRWVRRWGRNSFRFQQALAKRRDFRALLWENTLPVGYLSPRLGHEAGLPVLAVPQNLEALAGGHSVRQPRDYPLAAICAETAALRRADRVLAICQAEQWFMAWHGIEAGFLPYYPPTAVRNQMLATRERRLNTRQSGRLLLMGTGTNPLTRQGMAILLGMLTEVAGDNTALVDIVGKETESLGAEFRHPRFHFHGRVPDEQLEQLLAAAQAALIHQPCAVGALTRVPELLMAGVPVIANPIAARSTGHLRGLHVFESPRTLHALCEAVLPPPPVPVVPEFVHSAIRSLQELAMRAPTITQN